MKYNSVEQQNLQRQNHLNSQNFDLISAHTKVDQWLLQHFKATVEEENSGNLAGQAGTGSVEPISIASSSGSSVSCCNHSITTLHIPTPKLLNFEAAANGAALNIPQLSRPITLAQCDYQKSPTTNAAVNGQLQDSFNVSITTTNTVQHHAQVSSIQQLYPSTQSHAPICHYQQHQNQTTLQTHHPFINPFKMDTDFWQQTRGAPFGLHAALATNHMSHHVQAPPHMNHQQQHQSNYHHQNQPHHHITEQSPAVQIHIQDNNSVEQDDDIALTEQQQRHHLQQQQQLTHHQQLQHHQHLVHNEQQQQHTQLASEHNHHLLFNAAAAAAAAAHLSGVVKSNELCATATSGDKLINNNNNTNTNSNSNINNNINNNNNNNSDNNSSAINNDEPNAVAVAKQEPHATNSSNNMTLNAQYVSSVTAGNSAHTQQSSITSEHQSHHKQHLLKFEQGVPSQGSLPLEAFQHQLQKQIQQTKPHTTQNVISSDDHKQDSQHHSQLLQNTHHHKQNLQQQQTQQQQQQPPVTNTGDNNLGQTDHQQSTTQIPPTSPSRITALTHHHTPTSSPQPSLTSPSANSSTPDIKFNNNSDNNKLPNELQVKKEQKTKTKKQIFIIVMKLVKTFQK